MYTGVQPSKRCTTSKLEEKVDYVCNIQAKITAIKFIISNMPKRTQSSCLRRSEKQKRIQVDQSTSEETFAESQLPEEDFKKYINQCVRYLICRAGSNVPLRKTDIKKDALQNAGRNYEKVMTKVTKILKHVYGYRLQICEETNIQTCVLISGLPYIEDDNENDEQPDDAHKILVMLVLTHVFMSNNSVAEASLFSFLQSLNIDIDREHKIFGDVKHFINTTMAKQKYLLVEVDPISKKNTYNWGPRADSTVSKEKLLNFVCKIYKKRQPKSFTRQYEDAKQQSVKNQEIQKDT